MARHLTENDFPGKHNFNASVAPTATDDINSDYVVGSRWIDTTADTEYVCVDNTATAAVWIETTSIFVESWSAPNVDIGAGVANGASLFSNVGAGFQVSFANNSDNEYLLSIPLAHNGISYDGSDLNLKLEWALFSTAPGAGDNVLWEVDYAFVKDDATQDPYTLLDATTIDDIDVSARTADVLYADTLSTMTGVAGAAVLLLTIRRNGQGGGSDVYGSSADVYGITINKV